MIEIIKVNGSHKYKISHVDKARLESLDKLPTQFKCDPALKLSLVLVRVFY